MKRQNLFNILLGSLFAVSTFLVSCSNDNPDENITSGSRILKFKVSQDFNENVAERAVEGMEKSDTIYLKKLNDSTQIKAVIKQDIATSSRAVYPVPAGTKVLAIVSNASTNEIYKMHELTVGSDGILSCEVPNFAVRIIFYSYNSTSDIPISDSSYGAMENYSHDIMWFKTQVINSSINDLGTIKFEHLISKVRVKMHDYRTISGISSFDTTLKECTYQDALVDIYNGTVYPYDILIDLPLKISTGTLQAELESDYKIIIPDENALTMTLNVNKIYGTALTGQAMAFTKKFKAGYAYTIHLYLEAAAPSPILIDGNISQEWIDEVYDDTNNIITL